MTLTSRGRLVTAIVIVALAFAAAFVVGRASAGSGGQQPMPARITPATQHVKVHVVALPSTLPALRAKPHEAAPATEKSSQPSAPAQTTTSPSVTPHTSSPPSGGGGGGGGGGGKVVVG
jgi:hypothetical protein